MNFLVDAQLPRRITHLLRAEGHDAVHTLDLPNGNATRDTEILDAAARENRVVVTKDADFVNSFVLSGRPEKLLLISTGNISNRELEGLLLPNFPQIIDSLASAGFVQLTRNSIVVHR